MSLFGANKKDEDKIRKAFGSKGSSSNAAVSLVQSQSTTSFTQSSDYETASEFDEDENINPGQNNETKQSLKEVNNNNDDANSAVTITHNDLNKDVRKISADTLQKTPAKAVASPSTKHDSLTSFEKTPAATKNTFEEEEDDATREYTGKDKLVDNDSDDVDAKPKLDDFDSALHRELSRVSRQRTTESKISVLKETLSHNKEASSENSSDEAIPVSKLEWDSPTDPGNPQNWSNFKKWYITMTTAFTALVVTFGSSLYTSGVTDMVVKGMASQELAISGLTFYVLGLSFGPMIAAPLSELYGRRIVYLISFPVSLIFTLGVGFSKRIREVLVLRFFAGLIGSPALAVCSGTIVDMWALTEVEKAMSFFCIAPFAGPIIGPVIGGFAVEKESWKWTMWIDLFFGALLLPFLAICPETYKPVILASRAKKRGIKVAKSELKTSDYIKQVISLYITKPGLMLATDPIVLVFSIWSAFIFAVLFGFFEAYPIIFRGVYKMSLGTSGLAFLGIGLGLVFGMVFYLYLISHVFWKNKGDGNPLFVNGVFTPPKPESRLLPAKVGAIFLPIGLFWVGWSGRESVHWIVPIIGGVPFGFGLILIFFSTITYFSLSYPPISVASAIAANNFLRYILASVFPLFTIQMYENVHIGWASTIFAFIALAMVPIPWVFDKYGPALRKRSTFSYEAVMRAKAAEDQKLKEEEHELEELERVVTKSRKNEQV